MGGHRCLPLRALEVTQGPGYQALRTRPGPMVPEPLVRSRCVRTPVRPSPRHCLPSRPLALASHCEGHRAPHSTGQRTRGEQRTGTPCARREDRLLTGASPGRAELCQSPCPLPSQERAVLHR